MDARQLSAQISYSLNQTHKNLLEQKAFPVLTLGMTETNEMIMNVDNKNFSKDVLIQMLRKAADALATSSPIIPLPGINHNNIKLH